MAELVRHRQTKGPETDRLHLNHRATPRLYQLCGCFFRQSRARSAFQRSERVLAGPGSIVELGSLVDRGTGVDVDLHVEGE